MNIQFGAITPISKKEAQQKGMTPYQLAEQRVREAREAYGDQVAIIGVRTVERRSEIRHLEVPLAVLTEEHADLFLQARLQTNPKAKETLAKQVIEIVTRALYRDSN